MLKKKRFWLGMAVTVICLYFVFRGIDFKELFEILAGINVWMLAGVICVYLFGYYIRAVRWHYLLKHIKIFKPKELFPYLVMGFMANNIFPARAGEFIRAYLTGAKKGISKSSAFASIIIERVFDGLVMIFYFILGYMAFHFVDAAVTAKQDVPEFEMFGAVVGIKEAVTVFAVLGSAVFIAIFILCLFLINRKEKTVKFLYRFMSVFPEKFGEMFNKLIDAFIEGLGVLRSKRDFFTALFYSFAAWTIEVGTYYFMAKAMGFELNFLLVCLVMAVANFAIMAPSTSGGVGPFEFFGLGVILLFIDQKTEAAAYILIIHAMILIPIIILGIIFMFTEGMDFKKLMKVKEEEKDA
ncbi:MAG: lysylphosphatidylglycerol synthase transmembrane domain-containing protein [Candidatus Goldiibacteriota bacterium]